MAAQEGEKMETVEILIRIPKNLYEFVKAKDKEEKFALWDDKWKEAAIANGTVLPKGHGDLKDAHLIKEELAYLVYKNFHNKPMCDKLESIVDNAPTVIEADKEVDG